MLAVCTQDAVSLVPMAHAMGCRGSSGFCAASLQHPAATFPMPQAICQAVSAGAQVTMAAVQPADCASACLALAVSSPAASGSAPAAGSMPPLCLHALDLAMDHHARLRELQELPNEVHHAKCDMVAQVHGEPGAMLCMSRHAPHRLLLLAASSDGVYTLGSSEADGDRLLAAHFSIVAGHASVTACMAATVSTHSAGTAQLVVWRILPGAKQLRICVSQALRVTADGFAKVQVASTEQACTIVLAAARQMTVYAQLDAQWAPVAAVPVPGSVHSLQSEQNLLFSGLRSQVIAFAPHVQLPSGSASMAAIAQMARVPLPPWHPRNVAAMALRGAHGAVAAVLRELLAVLKGTQSKGNAAKLLHVCAAHDALRVTAAIQDIHSNVKAAQVRARQQHQPSMARPAGLAGYSHMQNAGQTGTSASGVSKQAGTSSLQSGHFDMSAFGAQSAGAQRHAPPDALASGQLDMSSFSASAVAPAPPPQHAARQDALASGQVDMSACGVSAMPAQQQAPVATLPDALASGQINMSTFGASAAAPQRAPAAAAAAHTLASGQLDTAAFDNTPHTQSAPKPERAPRGAVDTAPARFVSVWHGCASS